MEFIMGLYGTLCCFLFVYLPYAILKLIFFSKKEDKVSVAAVIIGITVSLFGLDLIGSVLAEIAKSYK